MCEAKIKAGPLKWHGGKMYLADWIISLMPPRAKNPNAPASDDPGWLHYVEPFFGGGAVLLAQDPNGISEVVNDKNWALTNFWTVLQHQVLFEPLMQFLQATPFSQPEYRTAAPAKVYEENQSFTGDERSAMVAAARDFFILCRQSMSGRMKGFAPLTRNRTRSGMNEQASAWINAIEGLPAIHARLRRVVILNDDACKVIKQQDGPRTLFYCDPPYVHETRATTGEYEHEMTMGDHAALLETLAGIKGRFLLSGYQSDLYGGWAKRHGFTCHEKLIDNKASSAKTKEKKTECCWTNY